MALQRERCYLTCWLGHPCCTHAGWQAGEGKVVFKEASTRRLDMGQAAWRKEDVEVSDIQQIAEYKLGRDIDWHAGNAGSPRVRRRRPLLAIHAPSLPICCPPSVRYLDTACSRPLISQYHCSTPPHAPLTGTPPPRRPCCR